MRQFEQDFLHIDVEEDGAVAAEMLKNNKFLLRNFLEERAQEALVHTKFLSYSILYQQYKSNWNHLI